MNFIYDLYRNENFTTYLIIALVVLVVLFIVVLIFGKHDQKLEETKKLQKIDVDAFKEKEEEPKKVEVPEEKEPVKEEVKEQPKEEEVHVTEFEPEEPKVEASALLSDDEPVISFDEEGLEKDLQELESIKKEFSNIELPKVEEPKVEPASRSNQEVYSSVYTKPEEPKEEVKPVKNTYIDDDGEEIELPTLK